MNINIQKIMELFGPYYLRVSEVIQSGNLYVQINFVYKGKVIGTITTPGCIVSKGKGRS